MLSEHQGAYVHTSGHRPNRRVLRNPSPPSRLYLADRVATGSYLQKGSAGRGISERKDERNRKRRSTAKHRRSPADLGKTEPGKISTVQRSKQETAASVWCREEHQLTNQQHTATTGSGTRTAEHSWGERVVARGNSAGGSGLGRYLRCVREQ